MPLLDPRADAPARARRPRRQRLPRRLGRLRQAPLPRGPDHRGRLQLRLRHRRERRAPRDARPLRRAPQQRRRRRAGLDCPDGGGARGRSVARELRVQDAPHAAAGDCERRRPRLRGAPRRVRARHRMGRARHHRIRRASAGPRAFGGRRALPALRAPGDRLVRRRLLPLLRGFRRRPPPPARRIRLPLRARGRRLSRRRSDGLAAPRLDPPAQSQEQRARGGEVSPGPGPRRPRRERGAARRPLRASRSVARFSARAPGRTTQKAEQAARISPSSAGSSRSGATSRRRER